MPTFKFANIATFIVTLSASMLMASAQATPMVYTTTGTIQYGTDSNGLFGTASDLTGKTYALTFSLDPALYAYAYKDGNTTYTYGTSTSAVKETLTINGVTQSWMLDMSKSNSGETYTSTSSAFNQIYQYQSGTTTTGLSLYAYSSVYDYFANAALASAATLATTSYQVTSADYGYTYFSLSGATAVDFYSSSLNTLSINGTNVPEPAPLALLGLGMVALGVSRRKTRA